MASYGDSVRRQKCLPAPGYQTAAAPPPDSGAAPSLAPYIVFGYGSLIFRPPPHVINETPGFLKGYVRRFAQKSHDHRRTPEHPGRVVTLVHQEDWAASSAADAFSYEDVFWAADCREKDGHTPEHVDVYAHVPDGTEHAASARSRALTRTIWAAAGPPERNKDCVHNLAAAVRALAPEAHSSHMFTLEVRLHELGRATAAETVAEACASGRHGHGKRTPPA
ncbi:ChaC-like protein-domain-containing protein [Gloeopeniophorella convolvens]|nr:ChaC-like protein-domain-containing protein [Gloeopeniophorella convolvens]